MTEDKWKQLEQVGKGAALKEVNASTGSRAKNLKAMPESYFRAHKEVKEDGKTSLDFSAYIIEAVREKLERDKLERDNAL